VALLGLARAHLGAGLTGFEVMGALRWTWWRGTSRSCPCPLPRAPWTVLLEHSDTEGEAQARERFEACWAPRWNAGCVSDAVVAESLAQARALWHVRESSRWRRPKRA
jgi:hypothetical protein